jgi:hypothetical protein
MALVSYNSNDSDESQESTVDWSANDNGTSKRKAISNTIKSSKCHKSDNGHMFETQTNINWTKECISGATGTYNYEPSAKGFLAEDNVHTGARFVD